MPLILCTVLKYQEFVNSPVSLGDRKETDVSAGNRKGHKKCLVYLFVEVINLSPEVQVPGCGVLSSVILYTSASVNINLFFIHLIFKFLLDPWITQPTSAT